MAIQIQDKTVLITGANRGIGKAIVIAALERGASKVYAAVRTLASAQPLVEEFGERVVPIRLDLAEPQSIRDAADEASDVDVVVNNAGVLKSASVLSDDALESLEFEFDINTKGLIRIAQAFAPVLKANGGGALVQLNSVVSIKTFSQFATYSASKAASYAITQSLKEELGEQGTQVVSVHPGPIATDMGRDAGFEDNAESPSVVADALFDGLADGSFHVFPDTMAKQFWQGFSGYAEAFVEPAMAE